MLAMNMKDCFWAKEDESPHGEDSLEMAAVTSEDWPAFHRIRQQRSLHVLKLRMVASTRGRKKPTSRRRLVCVMIYVCLSSCTL